MSLAWTIDSLCCMLHALCISLSHALVYRSAFEHRGKYNCKGGSQSQCNDHVLVNTLLSQNDCFQGLNQISELVVAPFFVGIRVASIITIIGSFRTIIK